MAQLTIDMSGRNGLCQKWWGDSYLGATAKPHLRILTREGEVANGIYNPFKRYGYLSAGNNTYTQVTADGGDPNVLIGSTLYDMVNDDSYFAEAGQELYTGDGLNDTTLSTAVAYGASTVIHDLEVYQVNDVRKLFTIYKTSAGKAEIGISDLPYDTADDDLTWLTATVSGSFTNDLVNMAFMRVADNGFGYLFMDNQVHKIDGTTLTGGANGTITPNALLFPNHFQLTDACDYRGKMFITLRKDQADQLGNAINTKSQNAEVGVYIWDRSTTTAGGADFIPINGVKEIRKIWVGPQGDLRVMTTNSDRITQIRTYTGSTFKVIKTVGYLASPLYHDGLTVHDLMTTWYGQNGKIYSHGQLTEDDSEALYVIGEPSVINASGAILFGGDLYTDAGIYLSSTLTSGPTPRIYKWGWNDIDGNTAHRGDVFTPVKYLPQMSTVQNIEVYCRPVGTGTSTIANVKIYFNQSAIAWATKAITLDDTGRGYIDIDVNKPFVNSIQLETEFSTAIVLTGDTDFAPSYAVVNYTQTNTKG